MTREWKLVPGGRLGHLEIERELGQGAFGQVLLARDLTIGREVVVKVIRAGSGTDAAEALREARVIGSLNSPHIVTLHRAESLPQGDGWFLEMEYMPGGSVEEVLAAGRPSGERAQEIFRGLVSALKAAHGRGVVHGDVKPANVLLSESGGAKLADFGLARLRGEAAGGGSGREIAGTPLYMAPEVLMGEGRRVESDIWSAGVVLYRMLAGRLPFAAATLNELFVAVQNEEPLPLPEDVPGRLAAIALQALAKRPEERPPAAALVAALDAGPSRREPARAATALLGREEELRTLGRACEDVAQGRGRIVCVTGELGAGKTALVDAIRSASRGGFRWASLRLGLGADLLGQLLDAARRLGPGGGAPIEPPFESREQRLRAAEVVLETLSAAAPLALVVEDLDRIEEDERPLFDAIVRCARRLPLLLVVTAAGGAEAPALSPLEAAEGVEWIRLPPLPWTAVATILERQAEAAAASPELLATVARRADGNPLFALEMLRHMVERGIARASGVEEEDLLPRHLRELLRRRTMQLRPEARELLEIAAVDGPRFDGEALAAVRGRPILEVLRLLQDVCRRTGLIAAEARGFRFTHGPTGAALAEDLAPEYRAALHRALGEHLERRDAPAEPERLARHWEGAGDAARAAPYFRGAALDAARRHEYHRAIRLAARGGIVPGRIDAAVALANHELIFRLADAYAETGSMREAEALHRTLLDAARASGDAQLRLRSVVRHIRCTFFSRGREGIDTGELEEAARELPDSDERSWAHFVLGFLSKYAGDLEGAARHFERANGIRKALGLDRGAFVGQLASVALRAGRSGEAQALGTEAAALEARMGRRTMVAMHRFNAALARFQGGATDGVEEEMEEQRRLLALEGAKHLASQARVFQAAARWARGDLGGALAPCQEEFDRHRASSYLPGIVLAGGLLAELHLAAGDLPRVDAALAEVRSAADRLADGPTRACAAAVGALRHLVAGDREAGAGLASEGVAACAGFSEARSRMWFALALVEGCLYGIDGQSLQSVAALLADLPDTPLRAGTRLAVEAAGEFVRGGPGGAAALRAGAEALRSATMGDRRAVQRVIAGLFVAEASRREGGIEDARAEASAARNDARSVGHVWLEAAALQLSARLDPAGDARAELRALAERLGQRASVGRERLLAAWTAG